MPRSVPQLFMPFEFQINPHSAEANAHLNAWVREMGLIRGERAREHFERAEFGWFAACVYPSADAADLELVCDWFALMFLYDDQLDDGVVGRDPKRVNEINLSLLTVLTSAPSSARSVAAGTPAGESPIVLGLADLWHRMDGRADDDWRRRFIKHVAQGALAAQWESQNRKNGLVPEPATYIEQRRHTGAIYVCMDLIDIVERLEFPEALYAKVEFQRTLQAACDVVCWTNDLYSLEKELAFNEYHNLVCILERAHRLERPQAIARVAAMIDAETHHFLELEAALLAAFPDQHEGLVRYLAGMRSWMRGNLDWSRSTRRYLDFVEQMPVQETACIEH